MGTYRQSVRGGGGGGEGEGVDNVHIFGVVTCGCVYILQTLFEAPTIFFHTFSKLYNLNQ